MPLVPELSSCQEQFVNINYIVPTGARVLLILKWHFVPYYVSLANRSINIQNRDLRVDRVVPIVGGQYVNIQPYNIVEICLIPNSVNLKQCVKAFLRLV